jgi:hypothetical protein
MRRSTAHRRPWLILFALIALCVGAAWSISLAVPLPSRDEFNVVRWELRHLPNKWLYLTGRLFRGGLSPAEENARLGRYLELSLRIDLLAANASQPDAAAELARLERERAGLKNDVEAIIEGRITSVLEKAGLESSLPLFPDARWVFPPVAAEFEEPPEELVISPRDRIALIHDRPLRSGLSLTQINAIEQSAEREGNRSALVEPLGGVATYPSIVAPDWDYQSLVELAAHEWVHQYLFFKPLGSRFYLNVELRTLNETVATIAGQQIAALVVREYPLPPAVAEALTAMKPPAAQVDAGQALRALRLAVDGLLARGQIGAAEALMEQRRQELAQQGVYFRRINQAFFAFANVYATNPASTDPIGQKITTLRERTETVGAFLRAASRLTSEADLDRLLAAATSPSGKGRG